MSELINYLLTGLGKSGMEYFHLLGKELLQPLVLLDVIMDELDGKLSCDLDGTFTFLASVEPCLRPPHDAVTVRIDADPSLDVKALDVYLEVGKGIDDSLTV